MIIAHYLIMPKKNLLVTFKGYKDHYLKHPLIVKVVGDKHPRPIDYEINYPMKIKIVFLLRLLRARHSILSWRNLGEQSEVLFGTPPQFSLKNFDKWWTLQHKTNVFIKYPHELLMFKGEDFKVLHKSEADRELIENLGKWMSEYHALDDDNERKKRIKRLLSTDTIIPAPHHYLIMPKKNLLEAVIDYKDDYLKQSMITRIEGNNHERPVDYEIDYPMKIKIAFLLRLVRAINLSQQSDLKEQVKILFGDPPEFSLKNFDKWWAMQHRPNFIRYPHELLMFKGEDFKALHKSEADRELIESLEKLMGEYHALDDKSEEKKALQRLILGDLV